MFIFKFAGQTLNKIHFWSKIGDTAPLINDYIIVFWPAKRMLEG
jgi:hypothetical protein